MCESCKWFQDGTCLKAGVVVEPIEICVEYDKGEEA